MEYGFYLLLFMPVNKDIRLSTVVDCLQSNFRLE